MAAKHFINDPTHLVKSALRAITLTNPSTALDEEHKIIYRRPGHAPQVSLVSGGGSGHEPSFAAFVGHGFLSAAVAGTIFASPSAEQIRNALIRRVDAGKGVLVIVMNYTGDVLNFGMAVEKAKASGLAVEMLIVGDDVGVGRQQSGKVGRRGIAGTVLVQKVAGALASSGASLEETHRVALLTTSNIVSVGASLDHVHVPGRGPPDPKSDERLTTEEIEIGMGIHNEAGSHRARTDLPGLIKTLLAQLLDWKDEDRAFLAIDAKDRVVLLVNNLGGVSVLELGGITAEIATQLYETYGIKPVELLAGTYMTSLNGPGFSVTLLKLVETGLGPGREIIDLLHAPAEVTGWSAPIRSETWKQPTRDTRDKGLGEVETSKPSNFKIDPVKTKQTLTSGLRRVVAAESEITKYDTVVGDGDCGIGLKRGAEAILALMNKADLSDDAAMEVTRIAQAVQSSMDGTSGALYAIFLNSLAHSLWACSPAQSEVAGAARWSQALRMSFDSLGRYTPAQAGDRTLVDALHPFIDTLAITGDVKAAAKAARMGAERTKGMRASLGRTVYVGGTGWQEVPDPGAYGLSEFFQGLAEGL